MESKKDKILYRTQCKSCSSYLSIPFEYDYKYNDKGDIKIDRYKGDNINYHADNEFHKNGKILYSSIYCLNCGKEVGYWVSQAGKKGIENINKLFFSTKEVNMLKYDKNQVSKEEDRKFKQEDVFYNENHLTKKVIEYAKEHIDNFLKNVEKFRNERESADFCYKNFDRKILALKNLFYKNVKDRDNAYHLGIDFSKEEEFEPKKRNKTWNKKEDNKINEDYDNKSNGNEISNNINEDNVEDDKNEIKDDKNENGGEITENNSSNKLSGSDIYLDDKIKKRKKIRSNSKKNNNKEPSLYPKNNNKKTKKNKRKRK